MSIYKWIRLMLRYCRHCFHQRRHWAGHHRFTKGQLVEFTSAAFTCAHIGLAGVWEVKDVRQTRPTGSLNFRFHPQMIFLDNYPFGKQVSGYWLRPVGVTSKEARN
jgi:hypothetical protein